MGSLRARASRPDLIVLDLLLPKPFGLLELLARIEALLRRSGVSPRTMTPQAPQLRLLEMSDNGTNASRNRRSNSFGP